jgi:hypothetical protein
MNFQNLALDPSTLIETNFQQLLIHTGWRTTWTQIASGKFSTSLYNGLLFYSQSDGYAEFYDTNGFGGISFLQSHSDWRTSWTHIISGSFHSKEFTGLLFYDQQAGFAAIYDTDGSGGIIKLHEFSGWRTSWTHITTVRIPGSDFSGVVLYDQEAGHGEIHRCDGLRLSATQSPALGFSSMRDQPVTVRCIRSFKAEITTLASAFLPCKMDCLQPRKSLREISAPGIQAFSSMTQYPVKERLSFTFRLLITLPAVLFLPDQRVTAACAPVGT